MLSIAKTFPYCRMFKKYCAPPMPYLQLHQSPHRVTRPQSITRVFICFESNHEEIWSAFWSTGMSLNSFVSLYIWLTNQSIFNKWYIIIATWLRNLRSSKVLYLGKQTLVVTTSKKFVIRRLEFNELHVAYGFFQKLI